MEEAKLKEEVAILQQLEHHNIVKLHDVFDEPEHSVLVTEMMLGGDLLSRLNKVTFFHEYEARRICKVGLDVVSYIHSKEIGHRHLKQENMLLDSERDGAVGKLGNFGFAKREKNPNSFTTMCGTPAYVAPKVLTTLPYGVKADLWSVGIIVPKISWSDISRSVPRATTSKTRSRPVTSSLMTSSGEAFLVRQSCSSKASLLLTLPSASQPRRLSCTPGFHSKMSASQPPTKTTILSCS